LLSRSLTRWDPGLGLQVIRVQCRFGGDAVRYHDTMIPAGVSTLFTAVLYAVAGTRTAIRGKNFVRTAALRVGTADPSRKDKTCLDHHKTGYRRSYYVIGPSESLSLLSVQV